MDAKDIQQIKPFKLVKYFTFTSLIVILLGSLVLSMVIARRAEEVLLKKSEDYALLMAENLNHQVFLQFIIPAALQFGQVIQLRNKVLFERLDQVVRNTLHSFSVDMVNIFDLKQNVIFYSFDKELVGRKGLGDIDYQQALLGKSRSKLIRRGGSWGMLFGAPRESELRTYVALRAEKPLSNIEGPILGVFEIVQDLSDDYRTIINFKYRIIATSAAIMGILFLILRYVVKRGEKIIEKRAQERLLLKEKLSYAERLASLGEMVAGISHEIRNPLGIISSSAELLKQKMARTDHEVQLADVIVQEAGRLDGIVTDFMNFARPREPTFMPCKVDEILEKNVTFLTPEINKNGFEIHRRFGTDIPEIQADPGFLYQAFLNILMNAMQAMPEGGAIYIEVSARRHTLMIVFADEGSGIKDESLIKIWEPFFTSKDKGSGLGLPIVKKIIEGHGGTIEIENRLEKGAQVTITLPVDRD
ncbi:MAG: two-component sensor histidine kinase [Desulfobacterales bacterium C00003060]|nr:MAG: two-component sensor histidine kinase [Desulfobacterales bacterium S3730MH5]OEU78859.1 MAG: two-component sensor histidine kinase [Desulfobacterales bacterium S5133MH4]OEU81459.1 MAG: two-component sensor histidine kinase [Desulfobacterales bacterium C00003060]